MIRADAGCEVAIETKPGKKRRMPVDMTILKGGKLGKDLRVACQHTWKIHEFGETDHARVVTKRQKVVDLEASARGFE